MKPIFPTLMLLLVCGGYSFAQHEVHASVPPSERPVSLYAGLGRWTHSIATTSSEAQKYFDQGLALLYGFNRYEALRSFQKASELDPQAPMAYWGIAMAWGPYINMDGDPSFDIKESCAAAARGLAIKQIRETERAWLEAAAARCPDFADASRYAEKMRDLATRMPDDMDAQVLYAEALMLGPRWRWYTSDGKPADGVAEAERTLEAVLRRVPDHAGANHLYIHAVESSPNPERAIPSAQRLMGIVPAAGHLVHMPGHIWMVTGDFNSVVAVNERAAEVDRAYFARTGAMGSYYPYYLHNLQFILYARTMQGRVAETRKAEQQLRAAARPLLTMMPEMAGAISAAVTMAELRNYRWDELIAAERPLAEDPYSRMIWRYSRALGLAMKGRREDALKEKAIFEEARKQVNPETPMAPGSDAIDLGVTILEARLARSGAEALSLLRKAVAMQDALRYDEPPTWYPQARESLGAALLRAGDAAGAEAAFREGLRRSPRNGRLLFGLLESLKTQDKTEAAALVKKEFDTAWNGAEVVLRLSDL